MVTPTAFCIEEELTFSAPYESIRFNSGTTCVFCHGSEHRALDLPDVEAFESIALQPSRDKLVDLNQFKKEYTACDPNVEPERCAILRGLFGYGPVVAQDFPDETPEGF